MILAVVSSKGHVMHPFPFKQGLKLNSNI
uniref:Uncharacterized protein n=1 Tax=Lepeophtheirus salmonis TaxID=72036 RepID=A0A0K2TXJ6_LEPSM